uniref:NADH-ubiquinone oxidoreductase chain 4L n=1 Tax=Staphylinidae sp. BMNH 1274705 TaxID=1796598 RepID=A0A126TG57_9COLE|nr:NADH dehydrogenase subunit 4L [Staphylinidae sp. BMNH 1274705]
MVYLSVFMFLMGILSFCINRKHFLLMLLSLEFIILSLYLNMMIYLFMYSFEYYFSMIFLTMSVCEGALGLSILVSMIRSYGNDYFKSFNLLW